jgi:hypothetical protein
MFGRRPFIGSLAGVITGSVNASGCGFEKVKTDKQSTEEMHLQLR